jgi:hypothetical protein
MVQRNLTPGGDKNGADINLALDALEMAFTHPHINAFVIVGGDSDFISLVEKLKQYDKKVFIVGGRSSRARSCSATVTNSSRMKIDGRDRFVGRDGWREPAAEWWPSRAHGAHAARAGDSARASRAGGADRTRSLSAVGSAQEHAAATGFDVLRAQLRRRVVP